MIRLHLDLLLLDLIGCQTEKICDLGVGIIKTQYLVDQQPTFGDLQLFFLNFPVRICNPIHCDTCRLAQDYRLRGLNLFLKVAPPSAAQACHFCQIVDSVSRIGKKPQSDPDALCQYIRSTFIDRHQEYLPIYYFIKKKESPIGPGLVAAIPPVILL